MSNFLVKTFVSLKFQEFTLKRVSEYLGEEYRLAEPEEEAKGIDGYVGNISVSIKPKTYETKNLLTEYISANPHGLLPQRSMKAPSPSLPPFGKGGMGRFSYKHHRL